MSRGSGPAGVAPMVGCSGTGLRIRILTDQKQDAPAPPTGGHMAKSVGRGAEGAGALRTRGGSKGNTAVAGQRLGHP